MVSILLPSFNHAQYLEQRLDSIFNQTYQNFEVIILDDASNDNSLSLLKSYRNHPKVSHFITNEENSGSPFVQWAKGVELAIGEYLWIAESDDYADKFFLESLLNLADKTQVTGLFFSDSYSVDRENNIKTKISTKHALLKNIENDFYVFDQTRNTSDYFISDMLILNVSCVVFDLSVFKESIDLHRMKTYSNIGDMYCYISIFLKHKVIYLNKALNYTRSHGNNHTSKNIESGLIRRERLELVTYFLENLLEYSGTKRSLRKFLSLNFLPAIDANYYNETYSFLKKMLKTKIITHFEFLNLTSYVKIAWILNSPPFFLRNFIKKNLNKLA